MKRNDIYELMQEKEWFEVTVEDAYNLGFKNGCNSLKRYAVNVMFFDKEFKMTDFFRMFETLEDARAYCERLSVHKASTYLYEYNYVNEQYECIDNED